MNRREFLTAAVSSMVPMAMLPHWVTDVATVEGISDTLYRSLIARNFNKMVARAFYNYTLLPKSWPLYLRETEDAQVQHDEQSGTLLAPVSHFEDDESERFEETLDIPSNTFVRLEEQSAALLIRDMRLDERTRTVDIPLTTEGILAMRHQFTPQVNLEGKMETPKHFTIVAHPDALMNALMVSYSLREMALGIEVKTAMNPYLSIADGDSDSRWSLAVSPKHYISTVGEMVFVDKSGFPRISQPTVSHEYDICRLVYDVENHIAVRPVSPDGIIFSTG